MLTDPRERTSAVDDERVVDIQVLRPPEALIRLFPIAGSSTESFVRSSRERIRAILRDEDRRLLVVVGPCSVHDPVSAMEYARRLQIERIRHAASLEIVMRVYFEKPRTTVGWKGLINDPGLDESCRIQDGLRIARQLLLDINRLGLPVGCELLDTSSPQHISDLVSWGAIGARTTESQLHRELASGMSMPIGFKNGTSGSVKVAVDAIVAAAAPHSFLGIHKSGQLAVVRTQGNPDCHLILRGGQQPNYDAESVRAAAQQLSAAGLAPRVMVDCSHANARRRHDLQAEVATDVALQFAIGSSPIFGVMIESHLVAGAQKFTPGSDDPGELVFGQSITDPCLGWDETVAVMDHLARAVRLGPTATDEPRR
jgi:3-deoxy-7-phosphoheptulonate synthase